MTQAANLAALGTNAGTTGILPAAGGGTAGTAGVTGFKNRLINGAMQVWQRGTTSTSTGYQTVDRWSFYADSSRTISQSTDVPTGFTYSASLSGTGSTGLTQKIESLNTLGLVGQSITVSFWLKQSTGAGTNAVALNLYYPTASDNYNATVQIGSTQNFTTTTSWAQYSATFTNLPSGVANGIQCTIVTTSGSAVVFLLTGVQLEVGTAATNFDVRSYDTELRMCMRYYEQFSNGWWASGETTNYNVVYGGYFLVIKRAIPTCTLLYSDPLIYQFGVANRNGSGAGIVSQGQMWTWGGQIKISGFSPITTGQLYGVGGSVSAGNGVQVLAASAEL
jgi:hypothetical protein